MLELIKSIYATDQVKYLLILIMANLVLGTLASLRSGDFRLTKLADWLWNRVVPMVVGWSVVAFVATANADLAAVRDAVWVTLTAALVGYILGNLQDLGVPGLPEQLAGK